MKKLTFHFIFYLALISYYPAMAQVILWDKTIGGNAWDVARDIDLTTDGGVIVAGYSVSPLSGSKTENTMGVYDYWVVKLDSTGAIQWQNTIGGSLSDHAFAVEQTYDGGYIVGGYSESGTSGDKTEACFGGYDFWIVKLDGNGNILWENTIGGDDDDVLTDLKETPDHGFLVVGGSKSGISGDKTEGSILGEYDYWILKLDSLGDVEWQSTVGGLDDDSPQSVSLTLDGGFIIGGISNSGVGYDKTEMAFGGSDFWILKLTSAGVIQWQKTIGGNQVDQCFNVVQSSAGDYYVSGLTSSGISGNKTSVSYGNLDFFLVKLNSSGGIAWDKTYGGIITDEARGLCMAKDGGILISGSANSPPSGNKSVTGNGSTDIWILKTDTSGTILWEQTVGGTGGDYVNSILETADGKLVLCGTSPSEISGDKSERCEGTNDYWIVKMVSRFNTIRGKEFYDFNGNAVQDTLEPGVSSKAVYEQLTGRSSYTGTNGQYQITVADSGNFNVIASQVNYYSPVPASNSATFTSWYQVDSLNDFGYIPTTSINDLSISINAWSGFRSGMPAYYFIQFTNSGTTTQNPAIVFYPDSHVNFMQASPVPSFVYSDSIVWNMPPLYPFQTGFINISALLDTGLAIGSMINSSVFIEPVAGDSNLNNNFDNFDVPVTGSYDPNDILVNKATIYNYELADPPYLDYLIRFQNTGNDTAFYVRVGNNITPDLDLSSFEVVASSHPMDLEYSAHSRLMEFTFNNILLPDSNVNEPDSHGFIRYRIKPLNSLIVGDSILNRADIYFDFNQPVATNTAVTEIVMPVGIGHQSSVTGHRLAVYPNPFRDEITLAISGMEGQSVTVGIYDIYGRLVNQLFSGRVTSDKLKVTSYLSGLSGGIYLVRMESDLGSQHVKIIKY